MMRFVLKYVSCLRVYLLSEKQHYIINLYLAKVSGRLTINLMLLCQLS